MKGWLNLNGNFVEEKTPVLRADNRAFRYGDGLFETMRVVLGNIRLKQLHFQRLFHGMEVLQIKLPGLVSPETLEGDIIKTIKKNRINGPVRVRLTMHRGDGGLYEFNGNGAGYIIQVWPLSSSNLSLNENGHVIGLYQGGRKANDGLANIKSNNYLLYAMGALHAKQNKFNDCLIMNTSGRVCDSTVANLFWIKDGIIYTPPLSEGCVAGVMRSYLLQRLPEQGYEIFEKPAEVEELLEADEMFLSNAVTGLRWVKEFNGTIYDSQLSSKIFLETI